MANNLRKKKYFSVTLSIELVRGCLNRCFFCNSGTDEIILMPHRVLDRILSGLSRVKVDDITPFGIGESLLHREFYDFIEALLALNADRGAFNDLVLNTSGSLFDPGKIAGMIQKYPDRGFHRIHFSLDADFQRTWQAIGKSGSLASVKEKISALASWKQKHGFSEPLITVAMILHEQLETFESKRFLETWSNFFRHFGMDFENTCHWPDHSKNAIYLRPDSRTASHQGNCNGKDVMIKADGKVYSCVRTDIPEETFYLGDLNSDSLDDLLRESTRRDFSDPGSVPDFCRKCNREC